MSNRLNNLVVGGLVVGVISAMSSIPYFLRINTVIYLNISYCKQMIVVKGSIRTARKNDWKSKTERNVYEFRKSWFQSNLYPIS
jgi:hypothetical protein